MVPKMTHTQCVKAASKWLNNKCDVQMPEFFCWNGELADVIGFKQSRSTSILIECKVSRRDFLADKKKYFRYEHPESGMGDLRYYCCPKGLIGQNDLPDGWGLLYVYPSGFVKRKVEATWQPAKNTKAEHHLLIYYARRAVYAGVHGAVLSQRMYPKE